MKNQLSLISTAPEPIAGTALYRRWEGEREISPEYHGDAQNELEAIAQAASVGLRSVTYGGRLFVQLGGEWCLWAFPPSMER